MIMTHEARRAQLMEAAVILANTTGLSNVSHAGLAVRCECSLPTVRAHFPNRRILWRLIAEHSKASRDVRNEAILIGVK